MVKMVSNVSFWADGNGVIENGVGGGNSAQTEPMVRKATSQLSSFASSYLALDLLSLLSTFSA